MIVTYDTVSDFTTRWYRSIDLAQWYRYAATSWFWSDQLHKNVCKLLRHLEVAQTGLDEPSWQQPPCKRRKGSVVSFNSSTKRRVEWLVSWPTQMTSRTGRSIKAVQAELEAYLSKPASDNSVDHWRGGACLLLHTLYCLQ